MVAELQRLGLTVIWDLAHFGTPPYLRGGLLDPAFPGTLEAYARAFARRYRDRVNRITPWNEPFITAYFRGGRGLWPPYLKGPQGMARLLHPLVLGLRKAVKAIREENPEVEIWLNDGADRFHPATPELAEEAWRQTLWRYVAFDLLLGLAQPGQETYEWLAAAGYPAEGLAAEPVEGEVIGLDYYPESEHELYWTESGELAIRRASQPLGFAQALRDYYHRYRKPLFIAETSATQDPVDWLDRSLAEVRRARAEGIPVLGYTWWPLFDFYDWDSLLTRLEGSLCPVRLYRLLPSRCSRAPTPALWAFQKVTLTGGGQR